MSRLLMPSFLVLVLVSCGTLGEVDNSGGKLTPLIQTVVARHDGYTTDDAFRAESASVLAVFQAGEAFKLTPALKSSILNVLERHDSWVQDDSALNPEQVDLYLLSSGNIRATLDEVRLDE